MSPVSSRMAVADGRDTYHAGELAGGAEHFVQI